MGDIAAFPTLQRVLVRGDNITDYKATAAIKAGQAVCINATGVSDQVEASVAAAGSKLVGVAIGNAAAGERVAVAGDGCEVYVAQADDTATIDAGHWVTANDNAVKGTVSEVLAVGSSTVPQDVLGYLREDMAAGGTAILVIATGSITMHA